MAGTTHHAQGRVLEHKDRPTGDPVTPITGSESGEPDFGDSEGESSITPLGYNPLIRMLRKAILPVCVCKPMKLGVLGEVGWPRPAWVLVNFVTC